MNKEIINKNANNIVDALKKIWLSNWFQNITLLQEKKVDVKEIRNLLNEGTNEEEQAC